MRITESGTSANLLHHLQRLSFGQQNLQESLATGQRVIRSDDDPAAVRRVIDLQAEASGLLRFQKNIAAAMNISQASLSAVNSLKEMSDRAGQIAIEAEGIGGDGKALAEELNQMVEQALLTLNARSSEEYLFSGTATGRLPFVADRDADGRIVAIAYAGGDERREIPVSANARVAPHADPERNRELASFVNSLIQLRDDIQSGNSPSATGSRDALTSGEDTLIQLIGDIGATQLRLELIDRQAESRLLAIEERVSNEADADMVQTIVRFNQMQQTYQAALQSSGRLFHQSLLDYI